MPESGGGLEGGHACTSPPSPVRHTLTLGGALGGMRSCFGRWTALGQSKGTGWGGVFRGAWKRLWAQMKPFRVHAKLRLRDRRAQREKAAVVGPLLSCTCWAGEELGSQREHMRLGFR